MYVPWPIVFAEQRLIVCHVRSTSPAY
uniref:Uncharacterized protein n=1 Tax=Arundo donax TaxID=35708 RepID=A0A0A9A6S4_ARUDO